MFEGRRVNNSSIVGEINVAGFGIHRGNLADALTLHNELKQLEDVEKELTTYPDSYVKVSLRIHQTSLRALDLIQLFQERILAVRQELRELGVVVENIPVNIRRVQDGN